MKLVLCTLFLSSISASVLAQSSLLADYQWKNRLILLFAPNTSSSVLQQQFDTLTADTHGLAERDLLIVRVLSDQVVSDGIATNPGAAQVLRDRYQIPRDSFRVILIGKDGSEKLRKDNLLKREELYAVIDAMPMRQREIKRN